MLIGLMSALVLSCKKDEKSKDTVLGDFAKSVLVAGKAKDVGMLVSKLSMSTVAEGKAFMDQLKKSNPELTFTEGKEDANDNDLCKEMEVNARLFIDSYADVFDGTLSSISTAQNIELKGSNVYAMIIWVKQKDGKFCGVKIDSVWKKDDGSFEVLTWAEISGYYADKNVKKKQAILECDTADACHFPDIIQYKYVMSPYN